MPRSALGMGRLALIFLLFACDVSRDLRPELFACDAGGFCDERANDGSISEVQCPLDDPCTCAEDRVCEFRCLGRCQVECLAGSTCSVSCSAADCGLMCEPGADCTIDCTSASCSSTCAAGSSCEIVCTLSPTCECTGPACPF